MLEELKRNTRVFIYFNRGLRFQHRGVNVNCLHCPRKYMSDVIGIFIYFLKGEVLMNHN